MASPAVSQCIRDLQQAAALFKNMQSMCRCQGAVQMTVVKVWRRGVAAHRFLRVRLANDVAV